MYEGRTWGISFSAECHRGGLHLNAIFVPLLLFFTVVASVSAGILATYAVVFGILHSFGRASQPEPAPQQARLILVPTQISASGD